MVCLNIPHLWMIFQASTFDDTEGTLLQTSIWKTNYECKSSSKRDSPWVFYIFSYVYPIVCIYIYIELIINPLIFHWCFSLLTIIIIKPFIDGLPQGNSSLSLSLSLAGAPCLRRGVKSCHSWGSTRSWVVWDGEGEKRHWILGIHTVIVII